MSDVITNMIGQEIRGNSPYMFRFGQWARITGAHVWHPVLPGQESRMVWDVEFPDGATDMWAVHDKAADYEFREPA